MGKTTFRFALISFMVFSFAPVANGCKLWAVIGQQGHTFSGNDSDNYALISEQLAAYYRQGFSNQNGWSLSYYRPDQQIDSQTIVRSPVPTNQDSARFLSAVKKLLDPAETTAVALGHLRIAASGAVSIPDPHPFLFTNNGISYSFLLNGSFDKEIFAKLLTENGKDSAWINSHPPHTYGNGAWQKEGYASVVGAELMFFWIMKNAALCADLITGLAIALTQHDDDFPAPSQRNFVLSDGKRLLISGGANCLHYAAGPRAITFGDRTYWMFHQAVMTEPPGSGAAANCGWTPLLDNQLVVLSPQGVETYSYEALVSKAKARTISVTGAIYYDTGGDGFVDSISVTTDSAITRDELQEIERLCLIRLPGERKFTIRGYTYIDSSNFAILVEQDTKQLAAPVTHTAPYDKLTTRTHFFKPGRRLWGGTTPIADRIAPVILRARAKTSGARGIDSLFVTFSEPVKTSGAPEPFQPFCCIRHDGDTILLSTPSFALSGSTAPSDSLAFTQPPPGGGGMGHFCANDSIWINPALKSFFDTSGYANCQLSERNIRRIVIIDSGVAVIAPRIVIRNRGRLSMISTQSGRAELGIFTLSGRRIRFFSHPVRANEWVVMQWTQGESPLPFGVYLFSCTVGTARKQGILLFQQGRGIELRGSGE